MVDKHFGKEKLELVEFVLEGHEKIIHGNFLKYWKEISDPDPELGNFFKMQFLN